MTAVKVSVIIPAYNAASTIGGAISAVLGQSYEGPVELIVVDDGSTDTTAVVVRSFPEVRYFLQPNSGPASARNHGAAQAKGDLLFFTDADCRPEEGWLASMSGGFAGDPAMVVAGSYGILNRQDLLARIIHAEIRFRHLKLMPEYPRAFGSYNFAISSRLFRELGGFNADYRRASGEDNDLSYRVLRSGAKIRFMKDACVAHYHQPCLGKYLQEQFRHGFWRARLYAEHAWMAAGDDYTFWKDAVEVPLAIGHIVCLWRLPLFLELFCGFFLFEVLAGLWMIGFSLDGFCGGVVMWLRAFSRCAGLLAGGACLLKNGFYKGKKS